MDPNAAPGDIAGVDLWLKPDYGITESSNSVTSWEDRSSNFFSGTQGTGGSQPTFTSDDVNGYASISFDGGDYLDFGNILDYTPSTDEWSFFAVFNINNGSTGTLLARAGGTTADRQWQYGVTGNDFFQIIGGGGLQQGANVATGQWNIASSITTTSDVDAWLSGIADVTNGTIGTDTETQDVILGARTGGGGFRLTGSISEVIMVDNQLNATSRRNVETYLALKYGIKLNIATENYTVGGSSIYNLTSYSNNIAGIGQDDSQELSQTTSVSASGDILTISNANDLADGEFLVWGNDGGGTTTTTGNIPAGITNRVTQIWSLVETGDVGTVDVTFNLTTLGLTATGQDFSIIIAPSGSTMPTDLSSATVVAGGTIGTSGGDDIVTFSGVDFSNGDFFTLATAPIPAPGDLSSNIDIWLDADNGVTSSSSSISSWADQSTSGNDATQATADNQPTYKTDVVNGHASVDFDGTDDFLESGDIMDYTTDFSLIVVYKTIDDGTFISRASDGTTTNRQWQFFSNNNTMGGLVGGTLNDGTSTIVDEKWRIGSMIVGATTLDTYIDGTIDLNGVGIGTATETTNVIIGARSSGTGFIYQGDIAEIIGIDIELSDTQRRNIETYLAIKYGITLDITSLDYTFGGSSVYTHGSYPNDIAGIAIDLSQDLEQTSSSSVEGNIITVSNASGLADGESLIWGNDGGSTNTTTSDVPGGTTNRLERIWRVDETGDVGTVDISFDISALGIDESSSFSLIIAGSGSTMPTDLNAATVNSSGSTSTVDGSTILTFTGVDFADGDFFTLAGDLSKPAPGAVSSNITLWLKADGNINTSGSNIVEWIDESGNSNNAKQDASDSQPTVESDALNSNPVALFDGSNTMNSLGGFNTHEFFIVIDPNEIYNNVNAVGRIIGFEPGDFSNISLGPTTTLQDDEIITFATDGDGYRAMQVSTTSNFGDPSIINARHNAQVSATGEDIYRNGTQIVDTELNTGDFVERADQPYQLGEDFNPSVSAQFNGRIGEVISYSSTLSDADRRDVATYLAIKWGITLDISTQNYTVGGSSIYSYTAYSNDIAGIGMNNATQGLNQTTSKSVNDGSIVEISTASDLADGEYLVWGNDGSANTFTTSDVPSGASERLNKIWRITETGDVGTVTIAFDLTTLGIDVSNTTLNMIQAESTATMPTDLATSTLITGGTVSQVDGRDILTFTEVDFSSGDFFTLAGDVQSTAPGGVASNLQVWLRGDHGITESSGSVSSWSDKSGNGNDGFQGNTSNQPQLISSELNGQDVVDFTSQYLDGPSGFYTQDVFTVVIPDNSLTSASTAEYPLGFTNRDDNGIAFGALTGNLTNEVITYSTSDASSNEYQSGLQDAGQTYSTAMIINTRNNSGGTGQDIFVDGNQLSTTEANAANFTNYTDEIFRVGDNVTNSGSFDGKVAEVITYSSRNSDADRRDIESYLALRYGITLDISSETYTEGGTTIFGETTYSNDIAGIGQNLDNGLELTTSGSINSGAIVSMTGASDLDNGEYIIWGNEGTAQNGVQTSELPSGYDERLSTEWAVVTTGSPGTVTVRVYIGGIDNFDTRGQSASLYTLLQNSSASFTSITSETTASSISGDTLTFTGVSFTGTSYFTVAVPPTVTPGGTGNTLWLKADAGVTLSGTEVTGWADQSGNSNDASPSAGGPEFVSSQFNGNPSFNFSNESLVGAAGFNTQDYFIVLDPDNSLTSTSSAEAAIGFDAGSFSGLYFGGFTGLLTDEVLTHATNNNNYRSGETNTSTTYSDLIIINSRNNAGGTDQDILVNGIALTVTTANTFENFSGNYSIGNNIDGVNAFDGNIAEVLSFSSRQSDADRRDIESYLAIKYGISLDISSENYTVGGSSVYSLTSYANDIAAIGTSSSLGLGQTTSSSSNSDAIVTMSSATSQSDGDFVVWGNDNGVTTSTTSGLPTGTGITDRITRTWGVTETGDPGTVTVSFDLTGLGYSSNTIDDFTLIVDTNNDFTDGILSTYSAASWSSDIVSFSGVDFTTATNFGLGVALNLATDTDTDGIPDYFESAYGTNYNDGDDPVSGGAGGTDTDDTNGTNGDGISDALETILVNNGASAPITIVTDTDGDGISDHIEVTNGTNPFSAESPTAGGDTDSDGDGLPDGIEALIASEGGAADASISTDTDGDGITDYFEVISGTNPNDVNDPTTSGGTDSDTDNISDALEDLLVTIGATGPIGTDTDSDLDGIPDYIEAQTYTDPFNGASPAASGTPDLRSLQADYVASGGNCVDISGYQWVDVTDNLGNLVFSINPVGNDLGSTCWGVRILDGTANVRDNGDDWILNRNWYITPTTQPTTDVYVRLYSLNSENTDLWQELINDGESPGALDDFNTNSIRFTKISGLEDLDPFVTGGTRSLHTPVVADYSTIGKSYTMGFSSFSLTIAHHDPDNLNEVLPVEFISFEASPKDNLIELSWSTATEIDNDFFEVERSYDGETFESMGRVSGNGTTSRISEYTFLDKNPISGVSYYRLKQVDYDGTSAYSETISVNYQNELENLKVLMYPNPANDVVQFSFDTNYNIQNIAVSLVDPSGRRIHATLTESGSKYLMDIRNINSGVYIIQINVDGQLIKQRLRILR